MTASDAIVCEVYHGRITKWGTSLDSRAVLPSREKQTSEDFGMSTALARLAETARNQEQQIRRQERQLDRIKQESQISTQRAVGSVVAVAVAGITGAMDGALDLSERDRTEGDGAHVFGLPVTPIAGALLAAAGAFEIVPGGYYVGMAGVGASSGWTYWQARNRAAKSEFAEKRRDKFLTGP
jgi:hypothetical protein